MALSHPRGMWSYYRCSHKFFKHMKPVCTIKSNLKKDDHLALKARMCAVRHFSCVYLKKNFVGDQPNHNSSSFSCFLHTKNVSTSSVQLKNIKPREVISSVMEDVDFEKIKEQVVKERKLSPNTNIHMTSKIKEAVSKKCDEILANLEPEDVKKLKVIKLEHSFLYSEGHVIPNEEEMLSQNWLEALKLPSTSQRLKYYIFLAKRKFTKEADKIKRAAKQEQTPDREKQEPYEHGRLFMRIYESTMKRWLNYRLAASMQFGIPLVFDMDYAAHMRPQEIRNTASQLRSVYCLNRSDEELPFHLHLTNCQEDNPVYSTFRVLLDEDQGFLASVTEKSYLDLYDKKTLVYLSPHGRQVMREFDPNAVYIIAAFNDKATMQPISYARAKEQNIRCERLPLDLYTKWSIGSKNLTLDQMIQIMMSLKNNMPWQEAFRAVPKRKLKVREESDE